MTIHWNIVKETHTTETGQMMGVVLAHCGCGEDAETKAYEAAYQIAPEAEHEGRLVTPLRSFEAMTPGQHTKMCF